jgi:hypothetical protein
VPSTHNINSDSLSKVATSTSIVDRRGEQNVPKRYLKEAEWLTDIYLGNRCYVVDPDDETIYCAVDFKFEALQWGLTHLIEDKFKITWPAPTTYGLQIFDKERQDCSRWGPIDGVPDDNEPLVENFKFRSDQGDTPDPDINIANTEAREQEEQAFAALAQLIPTHITKPHIDSIDRLPLLAARMSQIAATTTLTSTSTLGQALETGVSSGGSTSANLIRNYQGGGGRFGGNPPKNPGGPPSDPTSGNPGGDPPPAGGGGNPILDDPNERLSNKLMGREPDLFDGD